MLAAIAWVGVIFFSSTSAARYWCEAGYQWVSASLLGGFGTDTSSGWLHFVAEKGVHVTLFFVLAMLLWKALPPSSRKFAQIVFIGIVVGSCSEFLQRFFPDRDPSIRDVCINVAAITLGAAVSRIFL